MGHLLRAAPWGRKGGGGQFEEGCTRHHPRCTRGAQLTNVLVQMELGSQPPLLPSLHSSMSLQT